MSTMSYIFPIFFVYLLFSAAVVTVHAVFEESLTLQPLEDGHILVVADFSVAHHGDLTSTADDFVFYPKPLGQLVRAHGVAELQVSLVSGQWKRRWGESPSVPLGAEVAAWFHGQSSKSTDSQWSGVLQGLAGLLCGSFQHIATQHSWLQPPSDFMPPISSFVNASVTTPRYGVLPRENVCTENLTPFLKLLPSYSTNSRSKASAGTIAGLLRPQAIFGSPYHSLVLRTFLVDSSQWRLQISVTAVIAPASLPAHVQFNELLTAPEPNLVLRRRPYFHRWTLDQVFAQTSLQQVAASATKSSLFVRLPLHIDTSNQSTDIMNARVTVGASSHSPCSSRDQSHTVLKWDLRQLLSQSTQVSIRSTKQPSLELEFESIITPASCSSVPARVDAFVWCSANFELPVANSDISIERWIASHDMRDASLHVRIRNQSPLRTHHVRYLDQFPWFMEFLYHTMRWQLNGADIDASELRFAFEPAVSRRHGHVWTGTMVLLPLSDLYVKIDFVRSFLRVEEFPTDVARGFDIGAARLILLNVSSSSSIDSPSNCSSDQSRITVPLANAVLYSTPLILRMPYPDFSMPFNVIAFTSTLLAFFFGSVFSLLFRPAGKLDEPTSVLAKLIARVVDKFKARRGQVNSETAAVDTTGATSSTTEMQ